MSRSKNQWMSETGGLPMNNLLHAGAREIAALKLRLRQGVKLAYYDSETEASPGITSRRYWAKNSKPDVVCVYFEWLKEYKYYTQKTLREFPNDIRKAEGLVSFNGDKFDSDLIARFLGISRRKLLLPRSLDLMRMIQRQTSCMHNLNNLAYVNLGESKTVFGSAISMLPSKEKKKACKSDVDQLRRLFLLYRNGKLKVPGLAITNKMYRQMPFRGRCPICGDIASINQLPSDTGNEDNDVAIETSDGSNWFHCFTCSSHFLVDGVRVIVGTSKLHVISIYARLEREKFQLQHPSSNTLPGVR